jgi:hypothetical protein
MTPAQMLFRGELKYIVLKSRKFSIYIGYACEHIIVLI